MIEGFVIPVMPVPERKFPGRLASLIEGKKAEGPEVHLPNG
jgi:hypothetical protein